MNTFHKLKRNCRFIISLNGYGIYFFFDSTLLNIIDKCVIICINYVHIMKYLQYRADIIKGFLFHFFFCM